MLTRLRVRPLKQRDTRATVTPKQMRLDLRFVTGVENPDGIGFTAKSFVVQDGVPGAQPA